MLVAVGLLFLSAGHGHGGLHAVVLQHHTHGSGHITIGHVVHGAVGQGDGHAEFIAATVAALVVPVLYLDVLGLCHVFAVVCWTAVASSRELYASEKSSFGPGGALIPLMEDRRVVMTPRFTACHVSVYHTHLTLLPASYRYTGQALLPLITTSAHLLGMVTPFRFSVVPGQRTYSTND